MTKLQAEIFDILTTDWHLNGAVANALSKQSDFQAARRKYLYREALGLTDESSPSLMYVMSNEREHFETDKAFRARLRDQLADASTENRRKRRKHRLSYLIEMDLRIKYAGVFDGLADQIAA